MPKAFAWHLIGPRPKASIGLAEVVLQFNANDFTIKHQRQNVAWSKGAELVQRKILAVVLVGDFATHPAIRIIAINDWTDKLIPKDVSLRLRELLDYRITCFDDMLGHHDRSLHKPQRREDGRVFEHIFDVKPELVRRPIIIGPTVDGQRRTIGCRRCVQKDVLDLVFVGYTTPFIQASRGFRCMVVDIDRRRHSGILAYAIGQLGLAVLLLNQLIGPPCCQSDRIVLVMDNLGVLVHAFGRQPFPIGA